MTELLGGLLAGFFIGWVWGGVLCNSMWWQWLAESDDDEEAPKKTS